MNKLLENIDTGFTRRAVFEPGAIIFREGDTRSECFIIESGEVEVISNINGKDVPVVRLGEGEIFGELALLEGGPRSATVRAVTQTETFVISRDQMRTRMANLDPLIGLLVRLMIERYRMSRKQSVAGHIDSSEPYTIEGGADLIRPLEEFAQSKEQVFAELKMEQAIRQAVEEDQFVPFLQPIISLSEHRVAGFEALIRWIHPDKGMVPPNEFIPVAERTQCVQLLDMLMLNRVCRLLPRFQEVLNGRYDDFFISVNLSGIHFEKMDVVASVRDILETTGANPGNIKLEITESALIGDPAMAEEVLADFKKLGVSTALDDFGTGYSSLGYLHKFSIDTIKIDRAFISQIHKEQKSLDIVRAIVGLSHAFKQTVVAEGIEEKEEANILAGIGCEYGQGFLFSKPLAPEEALEFARKDLTEDVA